MTQDDELFLTLHAAQSWMLAYAKSIESRNPDEKLDENGPLLSDIRRVQAEMDKINYQEVAPGRNVNGLTKKQVGCAEGWRLIVEDEPIPFDLQCRTEYGTWFDSSHAGESYSTKNMNADRDYRTKTNYIKFIKGDQLAPGHNPDKLTLDCVGEGYRLLEATEIRERTSDHEEIQMWARGWTQGWRGCRTDRTYKVPIGWVDGSSGPITASPLTAPVAPAPHEEGNYSYFPLGAISVQRGDEIQVGEWGWLPIHDSPLGLPNQVPIRRAKEGI